MNTNQEKESGVAVFAMTEIIRATNNFSPSQKIGQGGFGTVYKGKLKDGSLVAIKRAKRVTKLSLISAIVTNKRISLIRDLLLSYRTHMIYDCPLNSTMRWQLCRTLNT